MRGVAINWKRKNLKKKVKFSKILSHTIWNLRAEYLLLPTIFLSATVLFTEKLEYGITPISGGIVGVGEVARL